MPKADRLISYYTGFAIIAASILGGGTGTDLWTELFLFIIFAPFIGLAIARVDLLRMPLSAKIGCILVIAIFIIQFLPLKHPIIDPWDLDQSSLDAANFDINPYWSPSLNRSLYAALFTLTAMGFMAFVNTLDDHKQSALVRWFLIGVSLNTVLAYLQRSYSGGYSEKIIFPYEITFGFFANQNHFSALAYCSVFIFGYHFLHIRKNIYIYIIVSTIINIVVFSYDSRAGFIIVSASSMLSYIIFIDKSKINFKQRSLVSVFFLFLIFLYLANYQSLEDGTRLDLNKEAAIMAYKYFPYGSGVGSFENIYTSIASSNETIGVFFKHVHNDWFQLIIEIGIFFIFLFIIVLLSIFNSRKNDKIFIMSLMIIISLSIHSLVDYPLRTYNMAILFAFSMAICLNFKRSHRRALSD